MGEKRNFEFPVISINRTEYDIIQSWIESYKTKFEDKKLYIFGAGIRGNVMLRLLEEAHIIVEGFCDNSIEKKGALVKEYQIYDPEEICSNPRENYVVVSPENSGEIEDYLEEKGYEKDRNYFVIKNNEYVSYCREFYNKDSKDYIFWGDCFFTDLDIDDLQDKTMGELAFEELGANRLKVLSMHGMCIPSFYYLMDLQIKMGIRPKAVAFIVNIPFCNSIQTKLPQSQHAELLKMIQKEMPMRDAGFDQYVALTEQRSHNINAQSFSSKVNKVGKDHNYVEKLLTKTRYMYEFNEENENIVYLKKMLELLQRNNIKPLPFIPALNYYVGIDFYGDDFLSRYKDICDKIKRCIGEYGIETLDMSFLFERKYYSGNRMTKFPNIEGKRREISRLCDAIQE